MKDLRFKAKFVKPHATNRVVAVRFYQDERELAKGIKVGYEIGYKLVELEIFD